MPRPLLYYITDRTQFPGDELARRLALINKIAEAARSGVDYIQLREKDLSARELEEVGQEAVRVLRGTNTSSAGQNLTPTRLLINSRTDIALAVGADGVHLRSDDVSPTQARVVADTVLAQNSKLASRDSLARSPRPATRDFLVAVSCHSEEEVISLGSQNADFVVFAPVFEKSGLPRSRTLGLDQLRQSCGHNVPVLALGGVTLDNAQSCLEAGAAGIAGIRLFQQNPISDVVGELWRD
jgi:thiamine-phosphate pyrophosphorylase